MQESDKFPKNFLWGAATSSHQVEGNTHNDWSEWEAKNADRLAREAEGKFGHLASWPMIREEATRPENYISGRACDHYHRFREDFDIAKSLSHNAHRFSIEWSRIEPEEGRFDEREIEHYREVITALRERGLEPFVTLWHWTNPLWIRNLGGWKNPKTVTAYVRFARYMMEQFQESVQYWQPLNEPNIYTAFGYITGGQPPGEKNIIHARRVSKNLTQAHTMVYEAGHAISSHFKIGVSHAVAHRVAYRNHMWNQWAARILTYFSEDRFLEHMCPYADFLGIQYYRHESIALRWGGKRLGLISIEDEIAWKSDLGWQIYPEGMYHAIKRFHTYGKPIFITENGLADAQDIHRGKFIRDHIQLMQKAMAEGSDVRGYFHWSLLDNFEFPELRGFWPRFGLVEVDYKTLTRNIRPSAWEYKKMIEKLRG
ncbi:MAG: glycoside hydrolase family 1 protein [Candidatus Sungbacteria bacterium]|nr:glycoside hydrolase family 1 protein [bacterium]MDZ4260473.1 glycoside hydrolase family 1 protein [Candidatus Sungbacteria bacterium]